MSLASRFKMENLGMMLTFVFYAAAGIVFLALLGVAGLIPHIGLIGISSIVTAYGLFTKRRWSIWFVFVLFFVATTFSLFSLYYLFWQDLLTSVGLVVYLVLTWVFTGYVASNRKTLET